VGGPARSARRVPRLVQALYAIGPKQNQGNDMIIDADSV